MPTVPNWIGHAVVIRHYDDAEASKSWRATKTQVIVTLESGREVRFYLDGLRGVGADRGAELLDANAPTTVNRVARIRAVEAVKELRAEMNLSRLDHSAGNVVELLMKIGKIQRAATKAISRLSDIDPS